MRSCCTFIGEINFVDDGKRCFRSSDIIANAPQKSFSCSNGVIVRVLNGVIYALAKGNTRILHHEIHARSNRGAFIDKFFSVYKRRAIGNTCRANAEIQSKLTSVSALSGHNGNARSNVVVRFIR